MEELKELVGMVDKLPGMTLWILGGFLFYKLFIVGSWIALARLFIVKGSALIGDSTRLQGQFSSYDKEVVALINSHLGPNFSNSEVRRLKECLKDHYKRTGC